MTRIFVFLFIFNFHHCQSLSTVNPKTYFKPDLKRKESRLTGCQILVLRESVASKTLNNPFLRRGLEFSEQHKISQRYKGYAKWSLCQEKNRKPIKLKRLQPGNQSLIIQSSDFKLPLKFCIKMGTGNAGISITPKDGKYPVRAIIKPKKVLAGVEFRKC